MSLDYWKKYVVNKSILYTTKIKTSFEYNIVSFYDPSSEIFSDFDAFPGVTGLALFYAENN